MYEAYNATVESIDHDSALWRVHGPRAGALLDGRLAAVKNRVLCELRAASCNWVGQSVAQQLGASARRITDRSCGCEP